MEDNIAVHTMVLAIAVAVDDANLRARAQRRPQLPQQSNRFRDFVIRLQEQNRVDRIRGKNGIVVFVEDGLHIVQLLFSTAIVYITDRFRIDVHCVNDPAIANSARRTHRKPTRSATDVGHCLPGSDAENVDDTIHLQSLIPTGRLENGEVPCVGLARLAMLARSDWGWRRVLGRNGRRSLARDEYGEQENPTLANHY